MTSGQATGLDVGCPHCGSPLRADAPFCNGCGQSVAHLRTAAPPTPTATVGVAAPPLANNGQLVAATRGVRGCAYLLDLAALISPALPITIAAAILGIAEVVYVVIPVAFVAGWIWMSLWQGMTGLSFGKSMLGIRSIRAENSGAPGVGAILLRGIIFTCTAGIAAAPVALSSAPRDGIHDRLSGITLIDITLGANPFGARQQTALRKSIDRSLRRVSSPVPIGPGRQHGTGSR
jgi:hypothetical protein